MVDLNFTLVVQLLMFLGFLWLMDRWVLRPLLKTMDEREHAVTTDKEQALGDQEAAESIEHEYAVSLAAAHQEAYRKVSQSLREVQDRQMAECKELRANQHDVMVHARRNVLKALEGERDAFPELGKSLAHEMMSRIGLGGNAS